MTQPVQPYDGRVSLPSGGWAQLRDPRTLRAKDKKRALSNIKDHERLIAAGFDVAEGLIAMLVIAWQIPYLPNAPLPSEEISILGELEIPDSDKLTEAIEPARRLLFPDTSSSVDDADQSGSPTGPASA